MAGAARQADAFSYRLFARLLAALLVLAMPAAHARNAPPVSQAGVLDLRDWSFSRDGVVGLAGEWDFAWGSFDDPDSAGRANGRIRVPAPWNEARVPGKPPGGEGYGTYRLRVECRETARLALVMPIQHSAVRLYVNGREVAVQGTPGASREMARPAFVQQVAPLEAAACPLRIVAHVSNYDMRNGGLLRSLELGTERQLIERRERGLARDLFALGGIAVLSLLPVLVFLLRREERAPLWLGLYGLSSAAFVGLGGERLFQPIISPLGWQAAWKITLFCMLAGVAAFPAFLRALYPSAFPRAPFRVLLALAGALALLVLATPTHVFTQATPLLYALAVAVGVAAVAVPVRAALQGRRSAWLLLAGSVVLIGTSVHDTVQIPYQIADKLTPYGLLVFALAPVLLLAERFARALRAEELRSVEQQQRVDLLVNATKAGLLDTDLNAKRTTYSERLKEMLGYAPDADSSGWPPFLELTHPDDRDRIQASFMTQMRDLSVKSGVRRWSDSPDFRVRKTDGSFIWIKGEAISLTGADGRTLRQICSFIDISERKNQELELADRIKFIQDLFDSVPLALALRDEEGRYLFVNRTWERYLGARREAVIGKRLQESVSAAEADEALSLDRAALSRGPGSSVETADYSFRGKRFLQTRTVMTDGRGHSIGVLVASLDTTERYAMEQSLARERERLALLVRATKAGFMDWDALADTRAFSERFKEMLGYPRDADTAAWPSLFEMMHPDDRVPMRNAFRQMLRAGESIGERTHGPLEYRLRRADGSYIWVRGEGIAQVGSNGRTERFVTAYIDITELREMNQALEESVRLREEVDRIGRHDLKTPLNSIIAIPRLLRESGRLAAEDEELVAVVEQAGMRLLDMVNLSLDMFRMEQGSYPFSPQAVELRELLEKVARDLRAHADSKRVRLRVDGPAAHAWGEELLCYSMLGNLAKNALEASPEGGEVRLAVAAAEGEVHIGIHNAGAVPEAVRERFFEKYSTSGKSGGTGLGTYSARLMARTQGGDIVLQTSQAGGTTLSVRLQAAPAAAVAALPVPRNGGDSAPGTRAPLAALSVLVVDDDEYNLVAMRRYLPSPPLRVAVAVNGRAALDAVMADPPDAVVMDLDMPVMGGLEAAVRIRTWEETAGRGRRVMIAMSAHDDPLIGERCLEAGFDRFLTKPVSGDVLRRELAALVPPGPQQVVRVDADLEAALPGFLESRRALLEELSRALASGHREQTRSLAHRLAGSLALYGFHWAAGHGKMIEQRARDGALEGLATEIAALRRHLDTVRVEILAPNEEETR